MGTVSKILIMFFALTACAVAAEPDPLAILEKNCLRCHTDSKRKGGLLIDSRESLIKGGDTDPAIVPGKSKDSFMIELLFPDEEDTHMPPKSQLKAQEIAALEKWIDAGAKWDDEKWAILTLPEKRKVSPGKPPANYHPIAAIALAPDNTTLAVGRGNSIQFYQIVPPEKKGTKPELKFTRSLIAHRDIVQALAFSTDGKQLASGGFRSVKIWNSAKPEKPTAEFTEPFLGRLTALAFSHDNKRLLVADSMPSQIGRIHDVTLATKKTHTIERAHLDTIYGLVFSADGKSYATSSADKLVVIRDSKTHKIQTRIEGHTSFAMGAAFSPDGKSIATVGDDETVKIWNAKSGEQFINLIYARSGPFTALHWTADPANTEKKAKEKDPKKAKVINTDRIIAIAESGRPLSFTNLVTHEGGQRSTGAKTAAFNQVKSNLFALAFDDKSQRTYGGGESGELFVWDSTGKLIQTIEEPPAPKKVAPAPAKTPPATKKPVAAEKPAVAEKPAP